MAYVYNKGGQVFIVTNSLSHLLEKELALTPQLTVLTNAILKVSGAADRKLVEGRKLTLDGFWLGEDGLLSQFNEHYIMKDRVLFFVQEGVFNRVDREVIFPNGIRLRADATVLTPDGKVIRLQDGQGLSTAGKTLQAIDHVMFLGGKLVLQKDGSLIGLPAGVMGMSDGTKISASGLITTRSGAQFTLKEGQRMTLPGAAMAPVD